MCPTLHDLPARLDERLRAAGDATADTRLGLLIGNRRWLVQLAEAGEIVPLPAIAPVPLTRDWFRGLVNLRGALFTVVDVARFAGGEPTPLDKDARLLALGAKLQFNASILVSKMLGLRSTAAMRARTDLAHGARPAAAPWQGAVWVDEAGVEWQELGLAGLVRDERFLQIGR